MSGDYSRRRFDKRQDFSAVLSQQGRVQLDSDWNELIEIHSRRLRAETVGMMGRAVVPTEDGQNQNAFKITLNAGALNIGPGRIYVDGLLAENHGSGDLDKGTVLFDTVLEEDKATQAIRYENQPYLKNAQKAAPLPTQGQYAVYLDVWQREVTYLESADLMESAVGVDTTTRLQTVWQVKLQSLANVDNPGCDAPLPFQPSGGRLSTAAVGVQTITDPCLVPPTGGYRGLENRLYRVEIHDGGNSGIGGHANFKWSRDNASMATAVTAISGDRKTLTVAAVARDSVMRFAIGDWIEVTEDWFEFASQPGLAWEKKGAGVMARIKNINSDTLAIELVDPLPQPPPLPPDVLPSGTLDATRHTRVQRWDQRGKVFDTNGNLLVDLDAAPSPGVTPGVIPVPAKGASIVLEDGVRITFETANTEEYHVADYWNFVARTVDASVEVLDRAPPRGVHHHFCQLGIVDLGSKTPPEDCRTFWPPAFGGASCECTVCVSAEQFSKNKASIQTAIDSLKKTGGKLCLGPGIFALENPVNLNSGLVSIHVSGRGQSTVLIQPRNGPAFNISGVGITIEDLQVWMQPLIPTSGKLPPTGPAAFAVANVFDFAIQRCWAVPLPGADSVVPADPAIVLSGNIFNATIRDNTLFATYGVTAQNAVSTNLRILNNDILATRAGIELNNVFTAADTRISGNSIFVSPEPTAPVSIYAGMLLYTAGALTSRLEIDSNHVVLNLRSASAIACGILTHPSNITLASVIRIEDNDFFVTWVAGTAGGIFVVNVDAFEHTLIERNTVHGFSASAAVEANNATWIGLAFGNLRGYGQQHCGIANNVIEAFVTSGAYRGVMVNIKGDCVFSGNQVVNDNAQNAVAGLDVEINAEVIIAGNNRVKGATGAQTNLKHVSMALNPKQLAGKVGAATVLGNICSAEILVNGGAPSVLLNIKA